METHVRVLATLYLVVSGLGILLALLILIGVGGAAGIVGMAAEPNDAAISVPILGFIGLITAGIAVLLALPGLAVGIGLLKFQSWARVLGIVLSAITLLGFPLGTALGLYGLWTLLHRDTERLFIGRSGPIPPGA